MCGGCKGRVDDKIRILKIEDKQAELELGLSKLRLEHEVITQELKNNISDVMDKIHNIKLNVDKQLGDIQTTVGDILTTVDNLNTKNDNSEMVGRENKDLLINGNLNVNPCTRRDIQEEIEIDKRRGNLIFKGIKENQNAEEFIQNVVIKLVGEEGGNCINGVTRVGKCREGFDRPVRVIFNNAEKRGLVLSKASTLNGSEFKSIYVSPDLTPKQQLQDKTLRTKLKEFRDNSMENVKIKRGNIVQKNGEGLEVIIFSLAQTSQG